MWLNRARLPVLLAHAMQKKLSLYVCEWAKYVGRHPNVAADRVINRYLLR